MCLVDLLWQVKAVVLIIHKQNHHQRRKNNKLTNNRLNSGIPKLFAVSTLKNKDKQLT